MGWPLIVALYFHRNGSERRSLTGVQIHPLLFGVRAAIAPHRRRHALEPRPGSRNLVELAPELGHFQHFSVLTRRSARLSRSSESEYHRIATNLSQNNAERARYPRLARRRHEFRLRPSDVRRIVRIVGDAADGAVREFRDARSHEVIEIERNSAIGYSLIPASEELAHKYIEIFECRYVFEWTSDY
jgi:hypothetical protein